MFQNPEIAKTVLQLFLSINDQMDDSIRAVENKTTQEELKAFKRGVGHVMYEVFDLVNSSCSNPRPPAKAWV